MQSNNELKEIDIRYRACQYFDDLMRIIDFDSDNILLDENFL